MYVYGTELLLSFIISTSIILLIGMLIHRMIKTLIFLAAFILLRRYTGGYHAKTYLRCKIVTVATYLSVVLFSELFHPTLLWLACLGMIGISTILMIGPIESPNKPLTAEERKKHKFTGLGLFVLVFIFACLPYNPYGNVFYFSLASVIVLMLVTLIVRKEDKHEKDDC